MSELNGPSVAFECAEKSGMHLWEDQYLLKVINPQTGEPLSPGEEGELVATTLGREGMPLIRYRTGDLARIVDDGEPGACGRAERTYGSRASRAVPTSLSSCWGLVS
jgi:phenylacetate-CoA ligase